jgi:DNA polymerase
MACTDGRARGIFMYYGANTGRWSGKGIQPQNLPRDSFSENQIEAVLRFDNDLIEMIYGCPMLTASKCIRGMIKAPEGKTLICSDFSSIEARVLAYLAQEPKALEAFRTGLDLYKVTAADIYSVNYDEVTKAQRTIGKVAVLALGYQGWLGAFQTMAPNYGVHVDEDLAKEIILKWRNANPQIVKFWAGVGEAALQAVKERGNNYAYGRIKFAIRGEFLHCRLPSGRLLSYFRPSVERVTTKYGVEKEVIAFWGVDPKTKKYGKLYTYSGKLTENIVQATARDLLAEAMIRLEERGFPVTLHVHDEVLSEIETANRETLTKFNKIMAENPPWAEGLPLAAEGWVGHRYRKG